MRILLTILVLFSVAIFVRHVRISDIPNVPIHDAPVEKIAPESTPHVEPRTGPEPPIATSSHVDELDAKIDSLQNEREELKHSMEMMGFPAVLNGDRLSESERNDLLKKLSQLNDMEIQLVRLKNQKIDLETEVSL